MGGVRMGRYRDKLRIIADVLSIVSERARKTHIMYRANLSYTLVCRYLSEVLAAGLVYFDDEDCYVLTKKGKEFLNVYEEYSQFCKSLEEQSNHVNDKRVELEKMVWSGGVADLDANRDGKVRIDRAKK